MTGGTTGSPATAGSDACPIGIIINHAVSITGSYLLGDNVSITINSTGSLTIGGNLEIPSQSTQVSIEVNGGSVNIGGDFLKQW